MKLLSLIFSGRVIASLVIIIGLVNHSFLGAQENRPIAVLLIHGLAGKHTTWEEVWKDQVNRKNIYIGNYQIDQSTSGFALPPEVVRPIEVDSNNAILFFTLDFSKNQNLDFQEQGNEVQQVVEKIQEDCNPSGIILVAHSMGGLAARRYIMDYGTDGILGLITITTPHLGSFLAYSKQLLNITPGILSKTGRVALFLKYGVDLKSKAISYLKPDSKQMLELYDQVYPENLPTAVIISDWNPKGSSKIFKDFPLESIRYMGQQLSHLNRTQSPIDFISPQIQRKLNDGIVTVPSQDITKGVINGYQICPGYFYTNRFHMESNQDLNIFNQALEYILDLNSLGLANDCSRYSIGFILDSSGSMAESDPKNIRKSSIIQLLDYLYQGDDIFLVDFDNDARWINRTNFRSWNKERMIRAIQTIDSQGGTNIGAGLSEMHRAMQNYMIPSSKSAVMLFSDGKGNFNDESRWFAARGIPVYTVSYKDYADGNLLSRIADETGGIYIKANNEMDVILAFHQFISECKNNSWICSYQSEIQPSQRKTFTFHVDPGITILNLFCNWHGSKIELKLTDPQGKVYSQQISSNNEVWHAGKNYQSAIINKPQSGQWTAEFYGVEIPPQGEPFVFNVSADLSNDYQLSKGIFENNVLTFSLKEKGKPVDGKSVISNLNLKTPNNQEIDISNNFKDGTITFYPTTGKGDYTLSADFTFETSPGEKSQRHFERSVRIGGTAFSTIAPVTTVTGNFVKASLGRNVGNRPGIKCYIFSANDPNANEKALGIVTYVTDIECNVEVQQYLGINSRIVIGDIVKLDVFQWQNDKLP